MSAQERLDASLARVARTNPGAAGMTVRAGWPDQGVAHLDGDDVVVHRGWTDGQDDATLDAVVGREAATRAATLRMAAMRKARVVH